MSASAIGHNHNTEQKELQLTAMAEEDHIGFLENAMTCSNRWSNDLFGDNKHR